MSFESFVVGEIMSVQIENLFLSLFFHWCHHRLLLVRPPSVDIREYNELYRISDSCIPYEKRQVNPRFLSGQKYWYDSDVLTLCLIATPLAERSC